VSVQAFRLGRVLEQDAVGAAFLLEEESRGESRTREIAPSHTMDDHGVPSLPDMKAKDSASRAS